MTSGLIFGALFLAHLLRIAIENRHLAMKPIFLVITLLSATLCIWAVMLLRRLKR